jgi:hypothetical protein
MRWFLWDGWGPEAYFGTGDIVMQADRAAILVPALQSFELDMAVTADAPREATLEVRLNGTAVGELRLGPDQRDTHVRLPASLLFRGDNLLELAARGNAIPQGVRLLAVRLQRA